MMRLVRGSSNQGLALIERTFTAILVTSCFFANVSWSSSPSDEKVTTLHFVEAVPEGKFVASVSGAFQQARFLRFKYTPAGTSEGAIDKDRVRSSWGFAVTENCGGPCSKTSSALGKRMLSARRVDGECPLPYEVALELLDAKERVIDAFAFGIGNVCFYFHGSYYAVAEGQEVGKSLTTTPFEEIFLLQ
jgi:hypothetical protein